MNNKTIIKQKQTKENIHKDHRQRLKEKFLNSGLTNFNEHEALELLLFYSIPFSDTNPLAHKLINEFKNIYGVFDAPIDRLLSVKGLKEHSAILIKLIPAIMQIYSKQKALMKQSFNDHISASKFIYNVFKGINHEEFYVICLNANNCILTYKRISVGNNNRVEVPIREVTKFIFNSGADRIILAHNHPNSSPSPSDQDIVLTHKLFNSSILNDIDILDHIIASPFGIYSMAEKGVLEQIKRSVFEMLNYDYQSLSYRKFTTSYKDYLNKDKKLEDIDFNNFDDEEVESFDNYSTNIETKTKVKDNKISTKKILKSVTSYKREPNQNQVSKKTNKTKNQTSHFDYDKSKLPWENN